MKCKNSEYYTGEFKLKTAKILVKGNMERR